MKYLKIILLLTILWVLALSVTPALAQSPTPQTITVKGQLMNASSGEPATEGIPLMLHTFDGQKMTGMIDGVTGPDGTFVFKDVEVVDGRLFEVMATVGQTTYFSDVQPAPAGDSALELPVTFYDSTSDDSQLRIEQMHVLVDAFSPTLLEIAEIYIISNDGNRTIENAITLDDGKSATLRITLPQDAEDISFEQGQLGERFLRTKDGFADTFGVAPGQASSQFIVRYYLPYENGLKITHDINYPTNKLSVVLPQRGLTLSSTDLIASGTRQVQDGTTLEIFSLENPVRGNSFSFQLRGTPQFNSNTGAAGTSDNPLSKKMNILGIGLLLLGVGLLGGGVWWWQKTTPNTEEVAYDASEFSHTLDPNAPESAIVQEIAELDVTYQTGSLSEAEYEHQRQALKAKLKDMLLQHRHESAQSEQPVLEE